MGSFEFKGAIEPTGAEHGLSAANMHAEIHTPFQAPHAALPTGMEIGHAVMPPMHMPGAEAALAVLPGAGEPISPLIQMIMRMPGSVGLLSSLFEALQNFILPHTDFLAHLDFSAMIGGHGDVGMTAGLEHAHIDLSALPADAHIFQTLGHNLGGENFSGMNLHQDVGAAMHRSINVSGTVDANHPQFEGLKAEQAKMDSSQPTASLNRDGALAGPGLSSVNPANHLAGVQRVFSQKMFEGGNAGGTMQTQVAQSSTVPNGGYPSNMQASGNSFQTHLDPAKASSSLTDGGAQPDAASAGAPAHGDMAANVGDAQTASAANFGPSGGVSDTLGGRHLLAMNNGADVAPPNLNQSAGGYNYDHVAQSPNQISADGAKSEAPLQGLKAKELSLNGESLQSVAHHPHPGALGSSAKSLLASNSTTAAPHASTAAATPTAAHATNSGVTTHSTTHSTSHAAASVKGVSNHDVLAYRSPNHIHVDEPTAQLGDGTSNAAGATDHAVAQAPGSDAASAADAPVKPASFTIRAGDNLWNIAKNNLGDATRWQDLYKLNLDKIGSNPDLIHPGTELQMPDGQSIAQASTDATKYTVQHGDNLWNLSKKFLGHGERWGELYKLNHDVIGDNPRLILPGQELKLPGAEGSDLLATSGTPGDSVTAAATPGAPDAVPQTPPANFNAASPPQAEFGSPAPQAEAPTQSMAQPSAGEAVPVSMAPAHTLSGPGGAEAATISAPPSSNTLGQVASAMPTNNSNSVVSPSLAPDLSFFEQPANK